jgi:hypothetical protein
MDVCSLVNKIGLLENICVINQLCNTLDSNSGVPEEFCLLQLSTYFHAEFLFYLIFDREGKDDTFSETSVHCERTLWRYIPEHRTLHNKLTYLVDD